MPPRKKKKRSSSRPKEETPAESAGSLLVILGGVGVFLLILTPWDLYNFLPKVLGILASAFVATLGGLLVLPPQKRSKTAEQMVELFATFARALKELVTKRRDEEEE